MANRKRSRKPRGRAASAAVGGRRGERDWPRLFGEGTLIVLVLVVPVIIHRASRNLFDWKEFTLGLGVAVGLALVLLTSLARGKLSWASVRLNVFTGAFLLWALIGCIYSQYRFATISETGRLAAHVGFYWLVILSVREARQARRIIGAAVVAAVPVCIYAFVQAAGRDPVMWGTPTTRVFSFLGNPTYLAGFLVLLIPLALAAAWPRAAESGDGGRSRRAMGALAGDAFFAVVAVMMLVSLYLTVSLSPTIGLVLGAALAMVLLMIRGGRRVVRVAIPATAVGLILLLALGYWGYRRLPRRQQKRWQQALHFQDPYGKERKLIQRVGLDIFRKQPVVGKAYGTYAVYALERLAPSWYADLGKSANTMFVPNYAHNEFIEVLAETGVVGGLIFSLLILTAFGAAIRVSLRHPEPDWARLGLAISVGMTAFMLQNLFGVTFRQTGAVTFFWLSLGLLAVAQSRLGTPTEDGLQPRLRELRFRPLRLPALAAVGLGLALLLAVVAWLALRPVTANVLIKEADRAAKQGRFEIAAHLADRALELNPYSYAGYYIGAYAWGRLGNSERSLAANKKALALLPGNASVYYNLGVNYKYLGRLQEASENLKRAIDLMPTAMRHHAAMAEVLLEMGRYDEALPYAEEAVRLDPRDPGARLLLADVQNRRGDLAAAAAQMESAARLARGDVAVRRQLARLYFRSGKLAKAITACKRWLKVSPGEPEAYLILGACRYNQKDYAAARSAFRKAVELDPNNLWARLRLAYCYAQLKQFPSAKRELEWLASKHPETREGKAAAQLLRGGRRTAAGQRPGAGGNTPPGAR